MKYDFVTLGDRVEVRQIDGDSAATTICIVPINWSKEEAESLAHIIVNALSN